MKRDIDPTPKQERDFSYTEDRLNDREDRTPEDAQAMDNQDVLENYPREPINKDVLDEEQVNEVQQRVLAEKNASTNNH